MAEKIEINGKMFLKRTIETLSGVKNFFDIDDNLQLVAEAIDNPYDFPFLLEDIYDIDFEEEFRLALVRIQIDSKLHMREDLEREQLRLYVAETIEKMLYGDLIMDGNGKGKEMNDEPKKKKKSEGTKKSKNTGKSKEKSKAKDKDKGKGGRGKGKNQGKSKGKGRGRGRGGGGRKGKNKDKDKGT